MGGLRPLVGPTMRSSLRAPRSALGMRHEGEWDARERSDRHCRSVGTLICPAMIESRSASSRARTAGGISARLFASYT